MGLCSSRQVLASVSHHERQVVSSVPLGLGSWTKKRCGQWVIIRSTFRQSRPNKADLKCPSFRLSVRAYIRAYLRLSVHKNPAWGRGTPFPPLLLPCLFTSSSFAFYYLFPFPFLIHFTYFLLLSIRSLSTRIVPLRFQA